MMTSKFSVIIVSWKVKDKLERCLNSAALEQPEQLIVVDNASGDGSAEMVRQKFPQAKLIALSKNIGFAAANNLAAREAKGDLVLLNPDTYLEPGFFQALSNFWSSHLQAGVVGGRIIFDDNAKIQRSVRRFPTLWSSLLDALKLLGRFPKLARKYLALDFNYTKEQTVDQVMGACFAVKQEVWRKLGGFDENFFVWFEEVDFCKRAQQQGFQVWYSPELHLVHTCGASFSQLSYFQRYRWFIHSLLYYLKKHHTYLEWLLVWCLSRPMFLVVYFLDYVKSRHH